MFLIASINVLPNRKILQKACVKNVSIYISILNLSYSTFILQFSVEFPPIDQILISHAIFSVAISFNSKQPAPITQANQRNNIKTRA